MTVSLAAEDHPSLALRACVAELPAPLAETPSPAWLIELLAPDAAAPVRRSEEIRKHTRDLLRHGGYKPTGRGKPASEYLAQAAERGQLGSINLAVDVNNAASLHSGIPISVFDVDALVGDAVIVRIAEAGTRYVFNHAGQEIDASGLLCAFDHDGACGNAVKDAQRTKTSDATTRTLTLLWGSVPIRDHVDATFAWYTELLQRAGVEIRPLEGFDR